MRQIKLAIITMLFTISVSVWAGPEPNQIIWIKNEYKLIRDDLKKYESIRFEVSQESAEGSEGLAYTDANGDIRLIEVSHFGETGKSHTEYYYFKGKPFFVLEESYRYNSHIMITEAHAKDLREDGVVGMEAFDENKTVKNEYRYYFNNGKVLMVLGDKGKDITRRHEYSYVLDDCVRYYNIAKKNISDRIKGTGK
ncbi:MAG: hypothetical protein OEZ39_07895 [Gammaproteobacteria bacterium]|nr:hypothetical protein [Gammaproteobacteria bacterium]